MPIECKSYHEKKNKIEKYLPDILSLLLRHEKLLFRVFLIIHFSIHNLIIIKSTESPRVYFIENRISLMSDILNKMFLHLPRQNSKAHTF